MKVIRAVILIVVILGLTYLVLHISKLNDNIVNLEEEIEIQKVFVEQLEKDKKELTVKKNLLEVDIDALELEKYSLEKQLEEVQRKNLELERRLNPKKNDVSRGASNSRGRLLGTFEATAYTDDVESQGKWVGQTASGLKPQVGVIAVDPNVIPLGTKLYVEGYGNAIAGDVGGAIKGRMLDVFLPDKDSCMKWGRKQVNVWIVD